ncbi:OprD family porin [Pseudomonas jinjuensis]|uniref:Outer membrane porin, OprD family n=1 Tax=Pseudomonas jinjuensis TaxID=198616 RepID=A0A1H0EHL3_9PSED|nr:OprD family porin [Pseudomonas jinjuensis]SDN81766.1 outer membrane porin, OprD family [Pseudomonas jinjuensis]
MIDLRLRPLPFSLIGLSSLALSGNVSAAFIENSTASLELRNFYMNRDYRQTGGGEPQNEWSQGFLLRFESGYTATPIGVGLDAYGALGIKLDSARGRSGDNGTLPQSTDGTPADDFSELRGTAKFKLSNSVLRIGSMFPTLPVLTYNYGRLLPSSYSGGLLTSQEIDGLTLNVGRFTHSDQRNSSSNDRITYYRGGVESDHLDVAGGSYNLDENLTASYYYGGLADIYSQHFVGLVHTWPLSKQMRLRTDLRYFKSRDDGSAKMGRFDNDNLNGMVSLSVGGHRFSGAYQKISGDGEFPFVGQDPFVVNLSFYGTFTKEDMKSWQLRYDYDFAALGIPGLTFTTRYVNGQDALVNGREQGKEWERDSELFYTVQSGPLKNAYIQMRNITFRSSDGLTRDVDENRVIIGYKLAFW